MRKYLFFIVPVLLSFWLASCQTSTPEPVLVSEDIITPTVAPSPSVTQAVDYCISCHTDKQQLISTAKPIDVAESESKGVG